MKKFFVFLLLLILSILFDIVMYLIMKLNLHEIYERITNPFIFLSEKEFFIIGIIMLLYLSKSTFIKYKNIIEVKDKP